MRSAQNLVIFCHGAVVAIHESDIGCAWDELHAERCPSGLDMLILVFGKDVPQPQSAAYLFSPGVTVIERKSCFDLSKSQAFQVYIPGYNFYGEKESHFLLALEKMSWALLNTSPGDQTIVMSNDTDCPAFTFATCASLRGSGVVHRVHSIFLFLIPSDQILRRCLLYPGVTGDFLLVRRRGCLSSHR